jgi:glucosamine--fructose-6-phosphate aminotransferase (isomerizing)
MRREIDEIPTAVARLLTDGDAMLREAGELIRRKQPDVLVTAARGSSDHAATYLAYAVELTTGIPVASLGPSVSSIYHTRLKLHHAACLAISQSGRSPDVISVVENAKASGAVTLALTNMPSSPLATTADRLVNLMAGPEISVAATKSFVASVAAGLAVLAYWTQDEALIEALAALPQHLEQAIRCDWSALGDVLADRSSLFVLGRGPSNAVANEAALKFKETCGMHAEAYSAAEVLHGPASIVRTGFPVLALVVRDAGETSMTTTAAQLVKQGASVFASSDAAPGACPLPFVATHHPLTEPLTLITTFYLFIEEFARRRGLDPDTPPHLHKVTETL